MRTLLTAFAASVALALATPALAQKKYGPGASDTEIKIGQTVPYSGPASAYGVVGKAQAGYFRMINEQGGINGRKINFISLDDGYSPPKTVEMTRRLVEQDEVLAIFSTVGTATNTAIHKYLNAKKVPQLFVSTGAGKWNDPKSFPWTMGLQLSYPAEARIFAEHVLRTKPDAKIAILWQNDDFGKDFTGAFKAQLGERAKKMVVAEASFESTDPTVDSQVIALKASGADVLMNLATPRPAAQAIKKAAEIGWKPTIYNSYVAAQVGQVMVPAGVDNATGVLTTQHLKDPADPQWASDAAMVEFKAFMKKYVPEGDANDFLNALGVTLAQAMVHVLRAAGDDLTRENVMKQAASLRELKLPLLLPGIALNTSPQDYSVITSAQMARFDGKRWVAFDDVIHLKK